ncbi:DUF3823 domain-containing protein [Hufsiella ginkgonis]|uniref:DUF3823 domain-containing protein n=1 Tax=Hufsiella ginkgonis TaxID=2695274 RepID=A0A7K1XSS5_9SPHI|nr:DUF3823 domain-containing protein [Hufsiella ginkgonis]MXV14051.1 DUF3823 domain-containing protein [Hufsiella ginkgonis]
MRTIKLILALPVVALLYIGCSKDHNYDNYDAPNSGISGKLIDAETGDSLELRLNAGTVRYRQIDARYPAPVDYDIPLRSNGSFSATNMFAGTYTFVPRDGAFKYPDVNPVNVELRPNEIASVNFKVIPYYRISASINSNASAAANNVTFTYTINKSAANTTDILQEVIFMVGKYARLDETVSGERSQAGLINNWIVTPRATATTTPPILPADPVAGFTGVQRTFTIPLWADTGLPPGTYYFRVGVRTVAVGRYNYSKVIKATIN